jgi:electron transport complex protein RnfG
MKQILRITVGLTLSCLVAGLVMGAVFTVTDEAKKHNELLNVQETMLSLLGYGRSNPAPPDLKLHNIYRYIIEEGNEKYLGYMVPKFVSQHEVNISPEMATEAPDRKKALKAVLKPPKSFSFADSTIIAQLGEKRLAYLLPGEFPGFKTFISVMLAIDPGFKILGLDIMEHEEDPGLGGEIEQEYFENQFKNKALEKVKVLKVVKEPLPQEYRRYLETKKWKERAFSPQEIAELRSKYQDQDIYALTGATISSKAVTVGVRNIIKRFAYREKILARVISSQKVPVAF